MNQYFNFLFNNLVSQVVNTSYCVMLFLSIFHLNIMSNCVHRACQINTHYDVLTSSSCLLHDLKHSHDLFSHSLPVHALLLLIIYLVVDIAIYSRVYLTYYFRNEEAIFKTIYLPTYIYHM